MKPQGQQPTGATTLHTDIMAEVARATTKFPTWPTDPLHALAVLGEEYGELTKEVVQAIYEPRKSDREAVRREAIQTAAMAIRFVMSLDVYEYTKQAQHQLGHSDECLVRYKEASEGDRFVGMTLAQLEAHVEREQGSAERAGSTKLTKERD